MHSYHGSVAMLRVNVEKGYVWCAWQCPHVTRERGKRVCAIPVHMAVSRAALQVPAGPECSPRARGSVFFGVKP